MYKLKIISSTVRPGRKGPTVAAWVADVARKHGSFEVEVIDLGEVNLPLMNEANHPMLRKYEHEHTKKWSATIDAADAFIFVTSEYDFGYPASLRNALEYLFQEWAFKAAGVVSYGGVSAGTRAARSLQGDLVSLKIMPLMDTAVHIPFFTQFINDKGEMVGNDKMQEAANKMLTELVRWTKGLKLIKENKF